MGTRRRYICFGCCQRIGRGISIWFIDRSCCYDCIYLVPLAQGVKRLHDLNKSGWLILLCCVPIVGWIFALYMLFADGTVGPNPYGADPKNRMPYQAQPASVNVTVNVSREDVKVDKPVEAAPAPAEAPVEEDKEKAE